MELIVFAAVLLAAALHAGWNAVIKIGLEPLTAMSLIAGAAGLIAAAFVPVFGVPPAEAWPWLIASVVVHFGYALCLSEAYRAGDMGQVYPIARGTAPLLTATGAAILVGERLGAFGWAGIVLLVGGIFAMSLRGGRDLARIDRRTIGFALATSVTIAGYSLVDGVGARVAENAHAYAVMLFVLDGAALVLFVLARRGRAALREAALYWRSGIAGGAMSLAAYWIAIWAMTVAPIALVAALRETSVLFATAIAVLILKEPLRATRVGAAALILAGLAFIRLH